MRKSLFFSIVMLLLLNVNAKGQQSLDPLTASFKKTKPVQLVSYSPISQTGNKHEKKYLKKNSDFNDVQVDSIFKRIVALTGKPKGLSYKKESTQMLPYYKAYNLSDFSVMGYSFMLVWLPFDENQHMPEQFRPTAKEGVLFYTSKSNISTNGTDITGNKLPIAGTKMNTNSNGGSNIQSSSADLSTQVVNGKIGVMIVYYGNKSTEIAKSATAWTLYGNKQGYSGGLKNEKAIAEEIAKRGAYSEYIGYHFIKGGECTDAERYVKGRFNFSSKDVSYFIKCIPELYVNND